MADFHPIRSDRTPRRWVGDSSTAIPRCWNHTVPCTCRIPGSRRCRTSAARWRPDCAEEAGQAAINVRTVAASSFESSTRMWGLPSSTMNLSRPSLNLAVHAFHKACRPFHRSLTRLSSPALLTWGQPRASGRAGDPPTPNISRQTASARRGYVS